MKLKQKEYCHNCGNYVEFEFDDTTEKQIIICPNCGHEHWRELDEGQLTNIRLHGREQFVYVAEIPEIEFNLSNVEVAMPRPIKIKKLEVIGQSDNGTAIVKGEGTKRISNRRWGRDPRQG